MLLILSKNITINGTYFNSNQIDFFYKCQKENGYKIL